MDDNDERYTVVRIYDCWNCMWRDVPNMNMKNKEGSTCVHYDKIFVMGGCEHLDHPNWMEMLNIKTQTWKTLPKNPSMLVRNEKSIRKLEVLEGKTYVKIRPTIHDQIFDLKDGRWSAKERGCIVVSLDCMVELVIYGGKLAIL
uniref:FKB95-like N-terminal Kelch domain-containing protein n=1 Tax=Boechera stricta TaxID=72658 RepID=K4FWH1_BOEST|nr:hypothetical protein 7G9.2 [Boechera stricta]